VTGVGSSALGVGGVDAEGVSVTLDATLYLPESPTSPRLPPVGGCGVRRLEMEVE
jgi:hypothetical protein